MAWGQFGVSTRRLLSNGTVNWGPAATPTTTPLARSGILEGLQFLTDGSITATLGSAGSIARDIWGPWNAYSQISVAPNLGTPIRRHSGYSAYIDMIMRSPEGNFMTADTQSVAEIGADPLADTYAFPVTGTAVAFRFFLDLPLVQYIRDFDAKLGMFPLENPQVTLNAAFTPAGASAQSPFTISSGGNTAASATLFPYFTDAGSSVTIATPGVDLRRKGWQTPADPANNPDYNFVVATLEDFPQGSVNGASVVTYQYIVNSGLLLRTALICVDGGSALAESKLTNSNSLEMLFGQKEPKIQESGRAAHARMLQLYGFAPPAGVYIIDNLGKEMSLADVIDLGNTPNVLINLNLSSTLNASNSQVRVLNETLVPVGNVNGGNR